MNFTLDFEYTFEDYLEANKAHGKRRRWFTVSWYFFATMFTLAAGFTVK